MQEHIVLDDVDVRVVFKDIKNVHLSVHPPTGRVTISAPHHMKLDTVRAFAVSKLAWIRQQRKGLSAQERESPRAFIDRESNFLWGRRYLLQVQDTDAPPSVEHDHTKLILRISRAADAAARNQVMSSWYRRQVRDAAEGLLRQWIPIVGVAPRRLIVRQLKTMWGSCTPETETMRLNTELAKKPSECLEYVVVHELVHLHEPTHNARFVALMNQFMPEWRQRRDLLNDLPVRHEDWTL